MPLQVIGEVPIPSSSPAFQFAASLGFVRRRVLSAGGCGALGRGGGGVRRFDSRGWSRRRNSSSTGRWAVWDMTCRRGVQQIAVRFRTGETTPTVAVRNTFMNSVQSFEITGGPQDELVSGWSTIRKLLFSDHTARYPTNGVRGSCYDVWGITAQLTDLSRTD
jgi:hypothetical protein